MNRDIAQPGSEQLGPVPLIGYYSALARRDLDGAVAFLADDVVFEVGTGTYEGRAAVKRWLRDIGGAWEDLKMDVEAFIPAGHQTVALVRFWARGTVSGIELSQRPAHLWTVAGATPTRMVSYADRVRAADAAGLKRAALVRPRA